MEIGKSYFVRRTDYGKIIVDGTMLAPIKPDPEFEEKYAEPEIGACVKPLYDRKLNAVRLHIIKRVARENQIVYE